MARLSKNLYVSYGGKTYTIPLYDTPDGMDAYSYIIVDGRQAYINLVAENSGLATTPLHIKESKGNQFRVNDRQICKVTVNTTAYVRTTHRGTRYMGSVTFYAIAGESIRVEATYNDDVVVNGTNTNTDDYTFTIWGDANITIHEYSCGDSSGCGGEGG